jgi:DNA-binding NarL/FixJ family response regulator
MKVLIIDDSNAVRPRLENALGALDGLDVSSCSPSAGGVIQRILQGKPDVIVVDVHMPGGALEMIRTIKAGAHPPVVIALSSSSALQYRAACHNAGAEYFFDKVREQERLVEAVAELQKELAC